LSFYLKAAPMATVRIGEGKRPHNGRVEWVGQRQSCHPFCQQTKPLGAQIELRAWPDPNYLIAWGPPCQKSEPTCIFTVTGDQTVPIEFPRGYVLTVTPDPAGTIRGPSWDCPQACRHEVAAGTEIVLKAAPPVKLHFGHWNGACAGQQNPC